MEWAIANRAKKVANTMIQHFAAVSQNNCIETFTRYKAQVESHVLNLEGNKEVYNQYIMIKECNHAIATVNESSPGPDEITYSIHQSQKGFESLRVI